MLPKEATAMLLPTLRSSASTASDDLLGRGFRAGGDGQGGKEKRDGPADDLGAAQDLVVAEALRRDETGAGPRRGDGAAVPQGNLRVSTVMEDQQRTGSGGSELDDTQLFPRDSVPRREADLHRIADRSRHPADARETAGIFLGIGEWGKQDRGADAKPLAHRQHAGRRAEGVADETNDVPGVLRHREHRADEIGDGTAPAFRSAVTRSVERDHGEASFRQGSHETSQPSGMTSPSVDEEHRGTLSPPPRREPEVAEENIAESAARKDFTLLAGPGLTRRSEEQELRPVRRKEMREETQESEALPDEQEQQFVEPSFRDSQDRRAPPASHAGPQCQSRAKSAFHARTFGVRA